VQGGVRGQPGVRVDRGELAAVGGVVAAYVVVLAARTEALLPGHPDWARPWDHQKYLLMADQPFTLRAAPFSWRVLEPLVVHVSPLDTALSFWLIAMASVTATAVAIHVLLRHLGVDRLLAWAGTLLFCSLGWLTGYPLYNVWLPDALAGLVIVLAAIAAADRRALRFAALLAVGVLVKEQVLLAAPLWYGLGTARLIDRRLAARTALLVAPAVVALLSVRLALPAGNADPAALARLGLEGNSWDSLPQDPRVLLATFGRPRLPLLPLAVVDWTAGAFGTLVVLAVAGGRANLPVLARWSPFLVGVYAQPFLASNTKRLVALAFPVVVVLAVRGLDRLRGRLALHDVTVLAVPVALVAADLVSPTNVCLAAELAMVAAIVAVGAPTAPGLLAWEAVQQRFVRRRPRGEPGRHDRRTPAGPADGAEPGTAGRTAPEARAPD
jgi:hypothetical protein